MLVVNRFSTVDVDDLTAEIGLMLVMNSPGGIAHMPSYINCLSNGIRED